MSIFTLADKCPECGATIAGGQDACQALFHEIGFLATRNLRVAAIHDLVVDTYCMQHIEPYCHSAKSYAAHLTRLCCGIEFGGDRKLYAALQKWLSGNTMLERPPVLVDRGALTIVDVLAAPNVEAQIKRAHEWAACVWAAYESQHTIARNWINAAR